MTNDLIVDIVFSSMYLIISIVAICISVKTLKNNNKMIEESTRPQVVVYSEITKYYKVPKYKIVIKNFGKSAALIKKFNYNKSILNFMYDSDDRNPFEKLNGVLIAPNQNIVITLNPKKIIALETNVDFQFEIEYCDPTGNKYTETFYDNISHKSDLLFMTDETKNSKEALDMLSITLQQISDNNL